MPLPICSSLLAAPCRATSLLPLAIAAVLAAPAAQARVSVDSAGFNAESDDGHYTFGVHGRVQFDAGLFDNDDRGLDNTDGTELRRIRLAVSGMIDEWGYVVDFDFANGDVTGQSIALSHKAGPGIVSVGQIKPFISLENTTDDLWATMQERAWSAGIMNAGWRYGGQWVGNTRHWVYGINLYNQTNTDSDHNDGFGGGARVVWLPINEHERVLHLGADLFHDTYGKDPDGVYSGFSASVRAAGNLSDQSRFTLVSFNDDRRVDVDKYLAEFAWSQGPVYVQSEYGRAHYDDGAQEGDVTTDYAIIGWFLTGNHRGYDTRRARFTRPDDIAEGGAWELALRYDQAHGEQVDRDIMVDAATLGVNWYANRNVLVRLNYIHSTTEDRLSHATLDRTDALTGRLQITF